MSKYIYVHTVDNNPIQDAKKVNINDIKLISNGSVENIICDCLDSLMITDRISSTNELLKKIKIGGKIHLRFINLQLFGKHCYLNKLPFDRINTIINNIRSIVDDAHIEEILNINNNFVLNSVVYDGIVENVILERIS
jgi:hypothetical protein